jgi:hypothetical protein
VTWPRRTRSIRFDALPPRVPTARPCEEDEHPGDRDAGEHDHDRRRRREEAKRDAGVVHMVDREWADDVDLLSEGELVRDDPLRQLVGSDRSERDQAEAHPLAGVRRKRAPGAEHRDDAVRRRPHPDLGRPGLA